MKVKALFQNHVFAFICVYVPTSEVEIMLFLNNLNLILQICSSGEFLFLGWDFNCTEQNKKKLLLNINMVFLVSVLLFL